jgi:hypothetical protein
VAAIGANSGAAVGDKGFEIEHGQALVDLALCDRPDGARRRLEAVTLLVKLIRPVEFENKVSVNSRRVAGRIVDAGASGSAVDHRVRLWDWGNKRLNSGRYRIR